MKIMVKPETAPPGEALTKSVEPKSINEDHK